MSAALSTAVCSTQGHTIKGVCLFAAVLRIWRALSGIRGTVSVSELTQGIRHWYWVRSS